MEEWIVYVQLCNIYYWQTSFLKASSAFWININRATVFDDIECHGESQVNL